jgi:DNA-binding CsgD family transcriptional regulator
VEPDRDLAPAAPDPVHQGVARREGDGLVRSGAELVGLAERFYGGVFLGAIGFVGLAALAALALLPSREFPSGAPVAIAFLATGIIAALTPLAVWRSRQLYRVLRRWPQPQLGLVLVAAALIASPAMSSGLWWPSCAILMTLAVVVPLRRLLAYCLLVLGANLAGHLVAADLGDVPAVDIIGLWIGFPLWLGAIAIVSDRLVAQVLHINATASREPPRRVPVYSPGPPSAPEPATAAVAVVAAAGDGDDEPATDALDGMTRRLTARQLEVVALLADGLRQREVAACLSISERQVQRHVADAVGRLGLRNAYELAAVAVAEGIVPDAAAQAARG